MSTTNKSAVATAVATEIRKKMMEKARGNWVFAEYSDKSGEVMHDHDTVRLNKITRPSDQTSALTEGALYPDLTPKAFKTEKIEATVTQMGDLFEMTDLVELTSAVRREDLIQEVADQYCRSLDYQLSKAIATGVVRHRLDNDGTYEANGTATSGSTTTIADTALATSHSSNDTFNGGFATVTNAAGTNYDVTRKVSDYVGASGTLTVAAFNAAIDTTSKFHVAVGTGIVATDVITISALSRVAAQLEKFEIKPFNDGLFRMPLNSELKRDLWGSTLFQNTGIYDDSERFKKWEIGRWLDVVFPISTQVYREDVDGTENKSGVVHVPVAFGRGCFEVLHWGNASGRGGTKEQSAAIKKAFGVNVYIIDKPDAYNPLATKWWIGWKANYANLVKRATGGIGLMCGATALPSVA